MKKFSLIVGLSLLMLAACVSSPSWRGFPGDDRADC